MRTKIYVLLLLAFIGMWGCEKDQAPAQESESCEVYDLLVENGKCTSDSTYVLEVDFKYKNTSSDSFTVYVRDGVILGRFHKNQLPLRFEKFRKSGKDYDFIKICFDNDCCKAHEWKSPTCKEENCSIYDLAVEKGKCTSDSTYILWVNFKVENPGNDSFSLYVRDEKPIGTYKLANLPLKIENFKKSGKDFDFIRVCINGDPDCCKALEFETPSCKCELTELSLKAGECTSDSTYKLTIDFNYKNTGQDYFDVYVRGGKHIGYYKLADLPITITNFKVSGLEYDFVKICVNDNLDCCIGGELKSPGCK